MLKQHSVRVESAFACVFLLWGICFCVKKKIENPHIDRVLLLASSVCLPPFLPEPLFIVVMVGHKADDKYTFKVRPIHTIDVMAV